MSPKQIIQNGSTPAWIAAGAAAIMLLLNMLSSAGAPSQSTLDDHEQRIRSLEHTTAERLASIDEQLAAMRRELARERDGR